MPSGDDADGSTVRGGTSPPRPDVGPSRDGRLEDLLDLQGFGLLPPMGLLTLWAAVGTVGYVVIEGWSVLDALYQTVITLSTVGLMEAQPMSDAGRGFTVALIVVGLGTALYAFTSIGQKIVEGEVAAVVGRRRMKRELRELEDHFVVCGFSETSKAVIEGLENEGEDFCVVEADPEREAELQDADHLYLIGDATEEAVLEAAGAKRARGILALLPSDADNLYVAMAATNMNPDLQVIARATDDRAERNLRRGGADVVVSPYESTGHRVVQAAINPTVLDFMELATSRVQLELSLESVEIGEGSPLAGATLAESDVGSRCGVIVVAVQQPDDEMTFNPSASIRIHAGDRLVALGEVEDLEQLEELAA
jgi:voltage-gated potassium channel